MADHRTDDRADFDPHRPGEGDMLTRSGRRTPAVMVSVGILVIVATLAALILVLRARTDTATASARLSAAEVVEIRDVLADRRAVRDAESRRVQKQLDDQARVLCSVIADFRGRANSSNARDSLDRASQQLGCARVGTVTVPRTPTPTRSTP